MGAGVALVSSTRGVIGTRTQRPLAVEPERADSKRQRRLDKQLVTEKSFETRYVGGIGRGDPSGSRSAEPGGRPAWPSYVPFFGRVTRSWPSTLIPRPRVFSFPVFVSGRWYRRFDDDSYANVLTSLVETTNVQALICTVARSTRRSLRSPRR